MPVQARTPQRLGGQRFVLLPKKRAALIAIQVAEHHATLRVHAALGLTLPTAASVMVFAKSQLGKRYCLYGCRCTECVCRDCSGEICYSLNKANEALGNSTRVCTSSFGFAQVARDQGRIIPKAVALITAGAIGIRNPFGGSNSTGSNGHIWFCEGDGVHSIEEGGHATGCYRGLADKSGDVIYAYTPGVDFAPVIKYKEREMVILPGAGSPTGRRRAAQVETGGQFVNMWNGAKVIGTDGHRDGDLPNLRRWYPKDGNGVPVASPDNPLTGVSRDMADASLLIVMREDGATYTAKIDGT